MWEGGGDEWVLLAELPSISQKHQQTGPYPVLNHRWDGQRPMPIDSQ